MTPRQADKLIKAAKPVNLTNTAYGETFTATITHRDRWNLYMNYNGRQVVIDRQETEIAA